MKTDLKHIIVFPTFAKSKTFVLAKVDVVKNSFVMASLCGRESFTIASSINMEIFAMAEPGFAIAKNPLL